MKKFTTLFALALAVLLTATATRADQPQCTGDRHKDVCACDTDADCNDGKSCIDGVCVTPPTTTTTLPQGCESDEDCENDALVCENGQCVPDSSCPLPAPCPPVTCTCDPTLVCNVDVCKDGKCTNGSAGTDGTGTCGNAAECATDTTINNVTVVQNRCPEQEDLVPCRRQKNGRLRCPRNKTPRRVIVPYSKAKASQKPGAKNPLP